MPSSAQQPLLVLVVDDDEAIQRALSGLLRRQGFAAVTANTVAQAVTAAEQQPVDAVILDLGLRGSESGLDFLAWLRGCPQYERIPILILTGAIELQKADEALIRRHRAHMFHKPQPIGTLVEHLRAAYGRKPLGSNFSLLEKWRGDGGNDTPLVLLPSQLKPGFRLVGDRSSDTWDHAPGDEGVDDGDVGLNIHAGIADLDLVGGQRGEGTPNLLDLVGNQGRKHVFHAGDVERLIGGPRTFGAQTARHPRPTAKPLRGGFSGRQRWRKDYQQTRDSQNA